MAEALLRHADAERFEALSAGSYPAGFVHPLASAAMDHLGVPMIEHYSKSWDEFADVPIDVVITLCDDAAQEPCPVWPGAPLRAHWPMPDPSFQPGTAEERLEFACRVADRLRAKIEALVKLDFEHGDPAHLRSELERIGGTD